MICIDADTPFGALQWIYEIQGMAESAQVCPPTRAQLMLTSSFFHCASGWGAGENHVQGAEQRAEGG